MIQNNLYLNSSGEGDFSNNLDEIYHHCIQISKRYIEYYPGSLENKVVLEIGTGFTRISILHMIKVCNLKKAYCYDKFNCLKGYELEIIKTHNLESYLDKLEYISGDDDKLTDNINNKSIDYIVSNTVLQHVDTLKSLMNVLVQILKNNGIMYHRVDLRCMNKFKKYGELYFHTFGVYIWKLMGNNIGQVSRRLIKDYEIIFSNLGLNLELNILEEFNVSELKSAEQYLENKNIDEYRISRVEFILGKK